MAVNGDFDRRPPRPPEEYPPKPTETSQPDDRFSWAPPEFRELFRRAFDRLLGGMRAYEHWSDPSKYRWRLVRYTSRDGPEYWQWMPVAPGELTYDQGMTYEQAQQYAAQAGKPAPYLSREFLEARVGRPIMDELAPFADLYRVAFNLWAQHQARQQGQTQQGPGFLGILGQLIGSLIGRRFPVQT